MFCVGRKDGITYLLYGIGITQYTVIMCTPHQAYENWLEAANAILCNCIHRHSCDCQPVP